MKIVGKIKSGLIGLGTFLLAIPTEVLASNDVLQELDDVLQELDEPPEIICTLGPTTITVIWVIARAFVIPIALLIGLLIYFKKSKSSKKKKILVTIGIILITAILYIVINNICWMGNFSRNTFGNWIALVNSICAGCTNCIL